MKKFNDWIAIKLTSLVGSMICAYAFAVLAIIGFPYGSKTLSAYIQWVSQTFIQLVMLSVIMVGQRLLSEQQKDHHQSLHVKMDTLIKGGK